MSKLIVSMNLSLDGFLSDERSGLDWHFSRWTSEMGEAFGRQLARADTMLLGRITYQVMSAGWANSCSETACCREDLPIADMMRRHRKLVVSGTLTALSCSHSGILNKGLKSALAKLKAGPGKDIILFGSASLLGTLLQLDLVDEYRLWYHPVALGAGNPMFGNLKKAASLKLIGMETFSSGVVLLSYQRRKYRNRAD